LEWAWSLFKAALPELPVWSVVLVEVMLFAVVLGLTILGKVE
jgi:hypothetical protein